MKNFCNRNTQINHDYYIVVLQKLFGEFFKNHRNSVPWTAEQRQTLISDCINQKLKINQNRGNDYCYCMVQKLELFWSYNDYLKATEYDYQEMINIIDKLCDYK